MALLSRNAVSMAALGFCALGTATGLLLVSGMRKTRKREGVEEALKKMMPSPLKSHPVTPGDDVLRVAIKIAKVGGDGPVSYKDEGGRFAHAPATIKMEASADYVVKLSLFPAGHALGPVATVTSRASGQGVEGNAVDEVPITADGAERSAVWKCDGDVCSRKERLKVWWAIRVDARELVVPLLVKVYRPGSKKMVGGKRLSVVRASFRGVASAPTLQSMVYEGN